MWIHITVRTAQHIMLNLLLIHHLLQYFLQQHPPMLLHQFPHLQLQSHATSHLAIWRMAPLPPRWSWAPPRRRRRSHLKSRAWGEEDWHVQTRPQCGDLWTRWGRETLWSHPRWGTGKWKRGWSSEGIRRAPWSDGKDISAPIELEPTGISTRAPWRPGDHWYPDPS